MIGRSRLVAAVAITFVCAPPAAIAQTDSSAFFRGLTLEADGKGREAIPHLTGALDGPLAVNALLALERVYSELGWNDSILAPAAKVISARPREAVARTVELRTLHSAGRLDAMWRAFERWLRDVPGDPTPYRDMSRLLIERGHLATADSIIERGRAVLGSLHGMNVEVAQIRAAAGSWEAAADAWRAALAESPYYEQAAAYSLHPTPEARRDTVRQILLAEPTVVAARLALAELESGWGAPEAGWEALRDLQPDSVVAGAWSEFAERAERAARWSLARDALVRALEWRASPELSIRAANAAMRAGDPAAALRLAPILPGRDSSMLAADHVPLHVRSLSALGRVAEAERLVARFDRFFTPGERAVVARSLAFGWARLGEMERARAALGAGSAEQDSSEAAGWIALYEGDLAGARAFLRAADEGGAELALALGLLARIAAQRDTSIGGAFLKLARGDTAAASAAFERSASTHDDGASLMLAIAARLNRSSGRYADADRLWQEVVVRHAESAEAPEASLELARSMLRRGDRSGAIGRLEDMLVRWPRSALAPQARRELESARRSTQGE